MKKGGDIMEEKEIYLFRNHKYTINLPVELMRQAKIKSRAAGFNEIAPYFRAILSREIAEGTMTLRDIIGEKEIKRLGWEKIISNKQRRYNNFVSLPTKNILDKIRKLSVYFSKDQQSFEF